MLNQLLNPMEIMPTAADRINVDQAAMNAAITGDALQEQRYRNRLSHIADAETMKELKFKQDINTLLRGDGTPPGPLQQQQAAPQPAPSAANTLMPGAAALQPPADPQAPAGGQPAQMAGGYDPRFIQALQPGGQLYQKDPQRAIATLQGIQAQQTAQQDAQRKAQMENVKMQVEAGKVKNEDLVRLQKTMEPVIRATTPLLEQYNALIKKNVDPQAALAQIQPAYEQMIKDVSGMPGYEDAAKSMPPKFNPAMAYLATDTYKAIETNAAKQAGLDEKKDAQKQKEQERKPTQFVTSKGHIIMSDLNGNQYVDGKPYFGPAYREKAGGGTPSAPAGPSSARVASAMKSGSPSRAVEVASEYFIYNGKLPPLGTGKEAGRVRMQVMDNVGKIATDLGMTLPELFSQSADIKANVASMTNLKKMMGVVNAAESQAQKNFDRLEKLYPTLGNGAVPMMNKVVNALKKGSGNPAPGTAAGVTYEAMMEYAKVISGQTTGAAVTDSASSHAQELLDILKVNPAEFAAKLQQYRGMMVDRKASLEGSYGEMKGHIGSVHTGSPAAAPAPAAPQPKAAGGKGKVTTTVANYFRQNIRLADTRQGFDSLIAQIKKTNPRMSDAEIATAFREAKGSL